MATDILAGLCQTLGHTNRPMSVRRILKFARESGSVPEDTLLDVVESALKEGVAQGAVCETRRGVYRLVEHDEGVDGSTDLSLSGALDGESVSSTVSVDAEGGSPREGNRRRRRSRRQRLADGPPVAPSSIEAAAALSVRSKEQSDLQEKIWQRVVSRAESIVTIPEAAASKAPAKRRPSAAAGGKDASSSNALLPSPTNKEPVPGEDSEASDPRQALRQRIRARRKARSEAPAAAPVQSEDEATPSSLPSEPTETAEVALDESTSDASTPRARLRARRRNRRIRASTDAALAAQEVLGPQELYVEKRKSAAVVGDERRKGDADEMVTTNAQAAAALDVLRREGQRLSYGELVARVGTGASGLKAAILAENNRRRRAGFRRPFVVDQDGRVGLTEWGLSTRYLSLENQIAADVGEQREIVRRALLEAVSELEVDAFAQLLVVLLERLGYTTVTTVHRQAGNVAVTAQRRTSTGDDTVAVVARQAWTSIEDDVVEILRESLAHFAATSGLLLTVGNYAESAIKAARRAGVPTVRLLDGAGFARLLYDNGIGLTSHQLELSYVDAAFFASLAEG